MGKKGKGAKLDSDPKYATWLAGVTWSSDKAAELEELNKMFTACGAKKGKCARAKFIKNFKTAVTVDGVNMENADAEVIFNASGIDYSYDDISLHEFMTLMIVLKGNDSDAKLKFAFAMWDKDGSGYLDWGEVEGMLGAMLADAKKKDELVPALLADLKRKDANSDNKISKEELLKAVNEEPKLRERFGKGATTCVALDSMISGKATSSACLVM